jgi:outer membrane protein insertion porin family
MGRVRNLFGGAEVLEGQLAFGTQTRRSFHASLSAPLTPSLTTHGILSVFGMERDNTSYASCSEALRGVKAIIRVS